MAIITAPENFKKLDRYKEISRRLSLAEGLTDEQARALAKEGKAVIWIDGGLHATEVLGAQQLIETIYQFASKNDEETHAHPARRRSSSRRTPIPTAWSWSPTGTCATPNEKQRSTGQLPRLYQKYVGHDNNRDFYMMNQPESIEHQPDPVSRVVPADHLQPSPDRPDRHGDVLAALPRSVQLRLRPARRQHARPGRRRDAHPLRRRRQARRDDAIGLELLDVVERRPAHDGLLPQPGRPADREHRQPDAGDDRLRARSRHRARRPAVPDRRRRCGTSASRSTTRSPPTTRCSTSRSATARACSTTSTWPGKNSIDARQHRQLDDLSAPHRRGEGRDREGHEGRRRHRSAHGDAAAASPRCRTSTTRSSASPSIAIRAATSCRPTKATS